MYWDTGPETNSGVFGKTTNFEAYKVGYLRAKRGKDGLVGREFVVPRGPEMDIWPVDWEVVVRKGGADAHGEVNGDAAL